MYHYLLAFLLTFVFSFFSHASSKNESTTLDISEKLKWIKAASKVTPVPVSKIPVSIGGTGPLSEDFYDSITDLCKQDELEFQSINRELLNPLRHFLAAKDGSRALSFFDKNAVLHSWFPGYKYRDSSSRIQKFAWKNDSKEFSSNRSVMKTYLSGYRKIEDVEITTLNVTSPKKWRTGLKLNAATLEAFFDLRGIDRDGLRRNDRGTVLIFVKKIKNNWKIQSIRSLSMETLVTKNPAFRDVTGDSGLSEVATYQRLEAIRRGGYSISLNDVDNDGKLDLFVGQYGKSQFFKGDGKKFREIKDAKLPNHNFIKTSVFSDFDNDGLKDLLLVRFVPSEDRTLSNIKTETKETDILVYKNKGNFEFSAFPRLQFNKKTDYAMPAAVADFDNDGFLDFYVGFPGKKDFTTLGAINKNSKLATQGLFFNTRSGSFTSKFFPEFDFDNFSEVTHNQKIFPHSALAIDLNGDFKQDILVVDDRGNLSPAYLNMGDRSFAQGARYLGVTNYGFGMGVAAGDLNNDQLLDLVATNVNFAIGTRISRSCQTNWGAGFNILPSNNGYSAFFGVKSDKYAFNQNVLSWPGEGLAGVEFLDYDNDGDLDIYLTNGLWTGTARAQDMSGLFAFAYDKFFERSLMASRNKTQSVVMEILANFQGDLATGQKGKVRPHLAGFQRNRLYRNDSGEFTEVGYLENVDSIADGYVIAKGDYDNDGYIDIFLRNADPGSLDVKFPPVQLYKNQLSDSNFIRVKLTGTKLNRDAIGATLTLETSNKKQVQQLIANNGTAQSETVTHFGIGGEKMAKKLTIRWPNGTITTLENIKAGTYTIREGENTNLLSSVELDKP